MSSETFRQIADQQQRKERRQAVAGWLRRLAEKIWPDKSYTQIQARVSFTVYADMRIVVVPLSDRGPETNGDGLRLYLRTSDYDAWRQARDEARRAETDAIIDAYRPDPPCPTCGAYRCPPDRCLNS